MHIFRQTHTHSRRDDIFLFAVKNSTKIKFIFEKGAAWKYVFVCIYQQTKKKIEIKNK